MRVLFDTTYARRAPHSGTGIYITRVGHELSGLVDLVEVWNPRRRPPAGGGLGSVRNLVADAWWSMNELPRLAARCGADLIHHPLPAHAPGSRTPQVITVVDLAFERLPGCFDRGYRNYAHLAHRAAARRARQVIAISETTASDLRECWRVDACVALLGPGQVLPQVPEGGAPEHFLYVGDDEPRKNLATLLEAYGRYRLRASDPLDLVLAGSATGAPAPGVRLERGPSPERIAALLASAAALVHPSLYEGFGMTPLEAMRSGTPVLAARSPGVVEICADAVLYTDPFDADGFAARMAQLAGDRPLRERLAGLGQARAREFSWASCAQSHVEAYSLALGG
jgi:glycosyltransferase involved in cell wall biosynthesis